MQGTNYQLDNESLLHIPIKYLENEITSVIYYAVIKLLKHHKTLFNEINNFNWLNRTFDLNTHEMRKYYELEYDKYLLKLKRLILILNLEKIKNCWKLNLIKAYLL